MSKKVKNILTFDVEDWYQVACGWMCHYEVPPSLWVKDNVNIILDILEEYGVKATFFVMSKAAEVYPEMVENIYKCGHMR